MTLIRICIAAAFLASSALVAPVYAEENEVPPVVSAILKGWEAQYKLKPTYESIKTDDDGNITISKLSATFAADGSDPAVKVSVGEMTLEDVSDPENGIYEVGSATYSDTKIEVAPPSNEPGFVVELPESSVESWYIKELGDNPTPADQLRASMNIAKKMSSGKIVVQAMGQTITSDGYDATWDGDPATGAGKFSGKLANVVIPEQAIALMDPSGTLKQLGYSSLSLDFNISGDMSMSGDKMGFSFSTGFAGKDIGALTMSGAATDIPLSAYAVLQEAQKNGKEPDFNAIMPDLMNVAIGSAALRFDDSSITQKLLPMAAAMQGMDVNTLVSNAGAMVQVGLMQLNNPAFTEQVVGAVNAFLKEPKSITVAMKPQAPVKVQELMGLDPANPGAAITQLGVTVTAND